MDPGGIDVFASDAASFEHSVPLTKTTNDLQDRSIKCESCNDAFIATPAVTSVSLETLDEEKRKVAGVERNLPTVSDLATPTATGLKAIGGITSDLQLAIRTLLDSAKSQQTFKDKGRLTIEQSYEFASCENDNVVSTPSRSHSHGHTSGLMVALKNPSLVKCTDAATTI